MSRVFKKIGFPGPNRYKLPSTLSQKGPTMTKKTAFKLVFVADSPGPAAYRPVPLDKYKTKAPNFTMGEKFEDPLMVNELKSLAPGPQSYFPNINNKYKSSPKYSFGIRRPDKFPPLIVCGDNVYRN